MARIDIVQHELGDNTILTTKRNNPTKETVLLGAEKVTVGVVTANKTIKTDLESGLKYETNEVVDKTIYNLAEQKHNNWLAVALETGKRGWYPGCVVWGILYENTELKADEDESSETLITIPGASAVNIITKLDKIKPQWYKVKYGNLIGYIKSESVFKIQYLDPII